MINTPFHQNPLALDAELIHRLETLAHAQGISAADFARQAADRYIDAREWTETRNEKAKRLGIVGFLDDPEGPTDLSTDPEFMEGCGLV